VNSYEPFRDGEGFQIGTAIHQVTKATNFLFEDWVKSVDRVKMKPVIVFLPLIVFEGSLYDCQPKDGDFEITKQSSFLYSLVTTEQVFLIDVLGLDFLDTWLNTLDAETSL
jgi:hypothetical protein